MLIFDYKKIGNKLLVMRKKVGMTQSEIAEAANLSDRGYAEIERGTVNMRMETVLKLCAALRITPDELLTECPKDSNASLSELFERLNTCTERQKETVASLLTVYLDSLR